MFNNTLKNPLLVIVKLILFGLLFLNLTLVEAKHIYESDQEMFNRVAVETDTVFIGRVLRVKTIKDGLTYANGDTFSIGIAEEEILKVFRGKINKGDKLSVCTWFDEIEYPFGPTIGKEEINFGIKVDNRIIMPMSYGYIQGIPSNQKDEFRVYEALKLKRKKFKDKTNVLTTYIDGKIVHNACNEPVIWSE